MSRPHRAAHAAAAALIAAAAAACSCSEQDGQAPGDAGADAGGAGGGGGGGGSTTTSSGGAAGGSGGDGGDWLHDPELWDPVAADIPCDVHVAKLPSSTVPRRTWLPCGEGCSWAPAVLDGQDGADMVVATEIDGEIYYRVSSRAKGAAGEGALGVNEVARLSDGEPLSLLRQSNQCLPSTGFDSPLLFWFHPLVPNGSPEPLPAVYVGVAPSPGAEVVWQLPGFEIPSMGSSLFDFDGGWGFIASTSTVKVATTAGSSALETVFSSLGYALRPVARGEQLLWSDWSDYDWQNHRARVRSWTESGGSVELVGGPYDVVHVAASDTKMVWVGAYGLQAVEGIYESAQLFWSTPALLPAGVDAHAGPMIPNAEWVTRRLATYGDLAATAVSYQAGVVIVVANLISQQVWSIPPRPGRKFMDVMAMNATSLLVQEKSDGPGKRVETILRFDLSKLDTLSEGLQ